MLPCNNLNRSQRPLRPAQPVRWLFQLLLLLPLFLTFSPAAYSQANSAVEIGSGTLDENRFLGPKWVRVNFEPVSSGTHTISVSWAGNADLRFSLFQVVNGENVRLDTIDDGISPIEWTGTLSTSEQYYLGLWANTGSADFTATLEAETQPPMNDRILLSQGTMDSTSTLGPRWQRINFDSLATATHTVDVSWDSDADVRYRIFEVNGAAVSPTIRDTNPGVWSGELLENTRYYISIWVREGVANFTAHLDAIIDVEPDPEPEPEPHNCGFAATPPQLTQTPTITLNEVLDYDIADFNTVLGPRHNVIDFIPKETGPITIALQWEGEENMNLAVFDSAANERLALAGEACVSGNSSTKSVTLNVDPSRQYHAAAWILSGTAEWVIRKVQTVQNPNYGISDAPDSAQRPNIVLINTDDQRTKTIDFMPAVQELLVEKGVTYPNTIVPTPSCCPSRATTLSGQYVHNNQQFQQQRVNQQIFERTFQKYLHQAGYFTGHAGKYLHWVDKSDPPVPYWDRWTYITGGFYDVDMNFDGRRLKPGGYTTDIVFERTKDYLRDFEQQNDDNPWFVYLAPTSPHSPWTAEYEFRNTPVDISDKPSFFRFRAMNDAEARHEHEQRARNLLSLDREIAEFIEYLDASGELDNTLIIFTSDNGYLLGEHQTQGKFTPYRDSVQVPFVMSWPGQVPENVISDAYVSHVDIAPTILNAAGIDTTGIVSDGYDIFDEARDTFYMEYFLDPEANGGRIGDWASLRTEVYQYTEWYSNSGTGEVIFREYYDMINDPYQLENLYENGDVADDPDYTDLSAQLLSARECIGTACP